jgi:hypothetical protein
VTVATVRAPFLDFASFSAEEAPPPTPMRMPASTRSPFLSVYELDGQAAEAPQDSPQREAFATLVDELHDEEFDEALHELESHARGLHDQQLAAGATRTDADRVLTQHFAQLIQESEAMVDAMAREFGSRDETGLVDHEFDAFLDEYTPSTPLAPEFENFFGSLLKKVGKVAKAAAGAAWKGIKAVALGPLFGQLRKLLRPIINMVLRRAIGALPVAVRPLAQKLAEKLGLAKPAVAAPPPVTAAPSAPDAAALDAAAAAASEPSADPAGTPTLEPAGADAPAPQQELDELIGSAFLAQNEDELNLEAAQLQNEYAAGSAPVFAELDDAREQFIQELNELRDGESAEPYIQNFLPAVMTALQLGIKVIGRQRVINFLSPLLAKLIGGLVGPANAPALSQAIVDSGLKLLNLEMSEAKQSGLAGSAVAATVEETLGRVAALPEYVLDNQELLEGFALEAFEQAAAANLPAVFPEATYRRRPDLLEAGVNAGWVLLPLRGRKRYKRCSRVFKVRVSPHMAEEVESFESAPLSEYLEDTLGVPEGSELEAEVHLYEALPGTTLADIARGERETLGAGLSDEANASQLHPLTPRASAVLLGRPGLGRASMFDPRRLAVGQRFYHLAIPGRRPLGMHGHHHGHHPHRSRLRRRFHLNVTLDSIQDQVRVCLFLSEVKAQQLAVQMRQQANVGLIAAGFRKRLARRLPRMFAGMAPRRLRIVHAAMPPGQRPGQALRNLPQVAASAFAGKLQAWLVKGFAHFLGSQSQAFLAATQDPADGVTLQFTIEHPPGLKALCQAAVQPGAAGASVAPAIAEGAEPMVRVAVVAGHRCA